SLCGIMLVLVWVLCFGLFFFFFSSRRRHTRSKRDWSSDVCYSDLVGVAGARNDLLEEVPGDVVRRQAPLAVQRAGEAVLVLQPEIGRASCRERVSARVGAGAADRKRGAHTGPQTHTATRTRR